MHVHTCTRMLCPAACHSKFNADVENPSLLQFGEKSLGDGPLEPLMFSKCADWLTRTPHPVLLKLSLVSASLCIPCITPNCTKIRKNGSDG